MFSTRAENYEQWLREEYEKRPVIDHDYEKEISKEDLDKYEQKYILVNSPNFKVDKFDVIFEIPEDKLTSVEAHET